MNAQNGVSHLAWIYFVFVTFVLSLWFSQLITAILLQKISDTMDEIRQAPTPENQELINQMLEFQPENLPQDPANESR